MASNWSVYNNVPVLFAPHMPKHNNVPVLFAHMPKGMPFELKSYLELELTGRCMRTDKRGAINPINSPILDRLNIALENWQKLSTQFTKVFHGAAGRPQKLDNYCASLEIKRRANYRQCEKLLA